MRMYVAFMITFLILTADQFHARKMHQKKKDKYEEHENSINTIKVTLQKVDCTYQGQTIPNGASVNMSHPCQRVTCSGGYLGFEGCPPRPSSDDQRCQESVHDGLFPECCPGTMCPLG
ncbi:complement inhibitor CirpT4-like [Rhipicephalus microplus]|uniref:complement inhibitor CirpT4-like n=1 Tax=Rhipicephalus microplus TaxID=6941 RepID=UPI003F6B66EE